MLILGAGLAGMSTAYELGKLGYQCTILEARKRPGGRCHTIRKGTVSEEDGPTQTAAYDEGMYFNPGPMRIPHHHSTTLGYAKELGVPVEVFIEENDNAYMHKTGAAGAKDIKYRRREVKADITGYTSELLAKALSPAALNAKLTKADADAFISYLKKNGGLDTTNKYAGTNRRGYKTKPGAGLEDGELSLPLPLHELLDSRTPMSLQVEYLHGAPMFQIVGGTDRLAAGFASKVGDRIVYGAEVKEITQTADGVSVAYTVDGQSKKASATYGVCTLPMPVLAGLPTADFSPAIKSGLERGPLCAGGQDRPAVQAPVLGRRRSDLRRQQHDRSRHLTGDLPLVCLSLEEGHARRLLPDRGRSWRDRREAARRPREAGADAGRRDPSAVSDKEFETSFSVSWHRVPWTRGGWASWSAEGRKTTYAAMIKGDRRMYFAGDHMTYLIGWMNGALESGRSVAAAIHARAPQEARTA